MMGAERAQAEAAAFESEIRPQEDWLGTPAEPDELAAPPPVAEAAPPARRSTGVRLFGALILLLALGWLGAVGAAWWQARPAPILPNFVAWSAMLSGPLVLLALLWLLLGRTSRREAERFSRAVQTMTAESRALESVLEIVAARIEENHARLRGEAEKLMTLGDEASDRLGRVTHYLSKESSTLDSKAAALDAAAAAARVDIGVLLHDLPKAEEQARAVAHAMKEAGLSAHGQASALEAQLASLSAKGREADEVLGGAAQRLGAHVARIETGSAAAASSMEDASTRMNAAVDAAMVRAADAIDAARAALDSQGSATLATIEQQRSALERTGDDAARHLGQRLESLSGKMEALGAQLAAQEAASHTLVTGLGKELAELDSWFDQLGHTGSRQSERLGASVAAVRESTRILIEELGGGREEAGRLIESGREMAELFGEVAGQLQTALPAGLAAVEAQAGRAGEAMQGLTPEVERVEAATASIERQLRELGGRAAEVAGLAVRQDEATRALLADLVRDVDSLQDRFAAAGASGAAEAARLGETVVSLREAARALENELDSGSARADVLGGRAEAAAEALRRLAGELDERLPGILARIEEQADRTRETAGVLAPLVDGVREAAEATASRVAETEAALSRQLAGADALFRTIGDGTAGAEAQLQALASSAAEAQETARRIVADTGPELIDALLRVREAAAQASERARESISAAIPASAAALGEASRRALEQAVSETVERQMGEIALVSERAVTAARKASERLTRQMLALGETTAAIEARIDEARRESEQKDSEHFSRRVALLIESLNSTAIDVTKILSNDVTDSAWAAYLKGDRGVFTRRAVRLLDHAEAKEIARHYEEEAEFREQVNRYIHDFEAMLRRILTERDGSVLGVTILSSDMGKLYVALAQAIERLR